MNLDYWTNFQIVGSFVHSLSIVLSIKSYFAAINCQIVEVVEAVGVIHISL